MGYNIAIDGPAGAGKSTIAKKVAERLQFIYVDTGAMYRAVALFFIRNRVDISDVSLVEKRIKEVDVTISYENGVQQVILNGENVTDCLRTEKVGNTASIVSAISEVRSHLLELQRGLARTKNVVMDGRDIGTNVLPNADLKIYLTASVETRAERRYKELREKGVNEDLHTIMEDIRTRDERDMNRDVAPLKVAEDAKYLDSSEISIEEVVERILSFQKEG